MRADRLVADVGGTNARFAVVDAEGVMRPSWATAVSAHPTFNDALRCFLRQIDGDVRLGEAAIAAAGPVDGEDVQLTNARWHIRSSEVSTALAGARVRLFNDLEAVALALPHLDSADLAPVGAALPVRPRQRLLAVNVGTGFGAATAIPIGAAQWIACPSEAGHMSFAVRDERERSVLERLAGESVEDALSGEHFVALYSSAGGEARPGDRPEDIMERCADDRAAQEAVRLFTLWLGRVCGDLALATASWGGVFLTGGVLQSWRRVADAKLFRSAFSDKSKMRARMAGVATVFVKRRNVALLGLARASL